jgi:hypothetical protein
VGALLLTAGFAPGCRNAKSREVAAPSGGIAHAIECRHPAGCYERAAKLCPEGYVPLDAGPAGPTSAYWEERTSALVQCSKDVPKQSLSRRPLAAPSEKPFHQEPSTEKLSPRQIAERARESVVVVRAGNSLGTGFAIGPAPGRIVTNLHVVAGYAMVRVVTFDGTEHVVSNVSAYSKQYDLALLRVPSLRVATLPLADSDKAVQGSSVVTMGNPSGLEATLSAGIISAVRRFESGNYVLQMTAPISPGSSGGPVFDEYGRVVGVATFLLKDGQNLNFAVPSKYVADLTAHPRTVSMDAFAKATTEPEEKAQAEPKPEPARTAPTRPNFPQSVAGFVFGMTIAEANRICGWQLFGNPTIQVCPFVPVHIPFASGSVTLRFDAGRLAMVILEDASFEEARVALTSKYGPPDRIETRKKEIWVETDAAWKRGTPGRATWIIEGGRVAVGSLKGKDTFVGYVPSAADAVSDANF